jgi:Na+/melibiose symporter-like transporter
MNVAYWIERYNIVPKALYFTASLLINSLHNYKAQFLVEKQKVPVENIGIVSSIVGINFVGSVAWTRLADRYSMHRTISFIAPLLYGLSACLFLVRLPQDWPRAPYVTAVMGLSHFFSSAIFPLLDAIVFAMLRRANAGSEDGNRALFGRQRLFGTLAIPVAGRIAYELMHKVQPLTGSTESKASELGNIDGFTALFINMFTAASLYAAIVYFGVPEDLKVGAKEKDDLDNTVKKPSLLEVLEITCPALPILLLFVLSSGYLRAIMNIYQNYMVDNLMHSKRRGPYEISNVRAASEALVFFFSKPTMELLGISGALVVSQIAGIARVLGYGLMPKREQSVFMIAAPLELLKGVNSGLVLSAALRLGNQLAPPNGHGTVHGLLAGTYTGLAMAIGGFLSSYLMTLVDLPVSMDKEEKEYEKLQTMFLISAAGSTVVLLVFIACFRMFVRLNSN